MLVNSWFVILLKISQAHPNLSKGKEFKSLPWYDETKFFKKSKIYFKKSKINSRVFSPLGKLKGAYERNFK